MNLSAVGTPENPAIEPLGVFGSGLSVLVVFDGLANQVSHDAVSIGLPDQGFCVVVEPRIIDESAHAATSLIDFLEDRVQVVDR